MTNPATTSLLDRANLDRDSVRHELARGLSGADDGELFLEYSQTEALMFDNGRLKQATYDTSQGFGLRAVKDDAVGYAHSSDVSLPALIRAADAVAAVRGGYAGTFAAPPAHTNVRLYGDENPLDGQGFESKVKLLAEIDAYVRDKDPRVRQVTVSLGATWQVVEILRPDGESYRDIRPLVRVNISVVAGQGDRQESGRRAMAAARAMRASSKPRPGATPPTARSAKPWSILNRCRRRPAKWTSCWGPAGPA
jgi:TldD protein